MTNGKPENAITLYDPTRRADAPLPVDTPAMDAAADPVTIDLTAFDSTIEPPQAEPAQGDPSADGIQPPPAANSGGWRTFAPLAASVALAALIGAIAGGGVTLGLSNDAPVAPTTATLSDENRALQEKVVRLSSELTAVKAGMDAANRTAASQLSKISERLDRAEKAQAEPAARLAKISDSLDRLERRVAASAPDTTGSVTAVEKHQAKPVVVEGWKLLDYYAGRAVLESRTGALYEVGPGSNLPGVGRVETVKRVDGKVVVTTPKGIITSALETPPPPRRTHYFRY